MPERDADVAKIKELIEIMKENDLVKIDIQHGDDRISLRRARPEQAPASLGHIITTVPGAVAPVVPAEGQAAVSGPAPAAPDEDALLEIKSPIVGTFYEAPSPDSEPYVEIGAHVDSQTVVCIIEAMKVMNEIKAETAGTVVEKLITNGQAVEYGQVLFKVHPD
jgi:acetyl-CoA carboxylase biotin carboxyl carrier protein